MSKVLRVPKETVCVELNSQVWLFREFVRMIADYKVGISAESERLYQELLSSLNSDLKELDCDEFTDEVIVQYGVNY